MNNIFSRNYCKIGCAPTVRSDSSPFFLPMFNAYGIYCKQLFHCAFLLFFTIIIPVCTFTQQYNIRHFSIAEGICGNSINHIFQDCRGYIWFATQGGGVCRFNGATFKNFNKTHGLISNDVTYITEDKNGCIWIGTAEGASKFCGNNFQNFNAANGLSSKVVYGIKADENGKVFFATEDAGLKIFNGTNFDSITTIHGLPSNEVYTITEAADGSWWLGLANGIARFYNGKVETLNGKIGPLQSTLSKAFFSSATDATGNLWFGATSGEVVVIKPDNSVEQITLPEMVSNDFIGSIATDKKGNLWFATDHGLLKCSINKKLNDGGLNEQTTFKLFGTRQGLSVNAVQAVMADYEGNIWAGTLAGGANVLSSESFAFYTPDNAAAIFNVTALCAAQNPNEFYVGTDNGLYIFRPSATTVLTKVSAVENINITSIAKGKSKTLWLTAQDGVYECQIQALDKLSIKKHYKQIAGVSVVSPLQVIAASDGKVWIATFGSGLFCITGDRQEHFSSAHLGTDKILAVFEDNRQLIWLGTQDKGLIQYSRGKFEKSPLKVSSVWSISEDNRGNMLLATGESGVIFYPSSNITSQTNTTMLTATQGLLSDAVTSVCWDSMQQCFWAGSEKGINCISFKKGYGKATIQTLAHQHGFKLTTINQHGILAAGNKVLFATVNGLWIFNRDAASQQYTTPKIQIENVRLFYEDVDWSKYTDSLIPLSNIPSKLRLPHHQNHITFDVQAISLNDVRYKYVLDGNDERWSSPSKTNEITFSNLAPGSYTFRVKALHTNGNTSSSEAVFSFEILTPWWKTTWFFILLVSAIISLIIIVVKTRERRLMRQNQQLEETVRQRTTVIEQQKQSLQKTLSEKEVLLKEIHHRVKNNLQTISSMLMLQGMEMQDEEARQALNESQSRVRSIALVHQKLYQTDGLEKVEIGAFLKDLSHEAMSFYDTHKINIHLQLNINETFIMIDKAIPIGLIVNELITNSVKHAFKDKPVGNIFITITNNHNAQSDATMKLIYADDGKGFDYSTLLENSPSLGLEIIQLLAEQIGAKLEYTRNIHSEFVLYFN